jgi:hypothetical protein
MSVHVAVNADRDIIRLLDFALIFEGCQNVIQATMHIHVQYIDKQSGILFSIYLPVINPRTGITRSTNACTCMHAAITTLAILRKVYNIYRQILKFYNVLRMAELLERKMYYVRSPMVSDS